MNQENKGVKSKCCGAGARFIDEIKCCRNCGNEFIPQPSESKEDKPIKKEGSRIGYRCDFCKEDFTVDSPQLIEEYIGNFFNMVHQKCGRATYSIYESLEEKGEELCKCKLTFPHTPDGCAYKDIDCPPPADSNLEEIWDTLSNIVNEKGDAEGKKYLESTLQQERQRERLEIYAKIAKTPIDKAHTYSSENADTYIAYDEGQIHMHEKIMELLSSNKPSNE